MKASLVKGRGTTVGGGGIQLITKRNRVVGRGLAPAVKRIREKNKMFSDIYGKKVFA